MLDLLTAVLAFAAIMIMLATLVTVLVEAVQKVLRKRRAGLQQMLEGLYESTLRDLVGQHLEEVQSEEISAELGTGATLAAAAKTLGQDSDGSIRKSMVNAAREALHEDKAKRVDYVARKVAAARFAEQLMRNPNFGWFPPRTAIGRALDWVRRRIVTYDFENIDTRQFIEQLANTEAGDKLAAFGEAKLGAVLRTVAYQFERYGEAASDYFARRAWAISVVVSIILAFVVNVDAVRMFKTLVVNPAISEKVHQSFEALQAAQAKTDAAHAKTAEPPQTGGQTNEGGEEKQDSKPAADSDSDVAKALEQTRATLAKLNEQGVPVGRDYFPFCEAPEADKKLCSDKEYPIPEMGTYYSGTWSALLLPLDRAAYQPHWLYWVFSRESGWWWFLSTLLAGALIGLGAPFWYDIYRKAALVLPVAQVAGRFVSAGRKTVTVTPQEVVTAATAGAVEGRPGSAPLPKALRRSDKATITPDELYDAFMRARSEHAASQAKARSSASRASKPS